MSREVRTPDARLLDALGHGFRDPALLACALTHSSEARERERGIGNERLEFLGDAVLDLVISRALYEAHPDWTEGNLSRTRAALVNARSLATRARDLGLGDYVRLGRTELRSAGWQKESILANVLEAVVGALYLDAGLAPVTALAQRVFPEAFDPNAAAPLPDPKTRLNERALRDRGVPPRYRTLADSGEEEADDRFTVAVQVGGETWGVGKGRTKRRAERAAAQEALVREVAARGD